MSHRLLLITCSLFMVTSCLLSADIIILKNGATLEGIVIADDGEKVTLSADGGEIYIKKKNIVSITKSEYTPTPSQPLESPEITPAKPLTPTASATSTATAKISITISDDDKTPEQIEINKLLRELADEKVKEPWQIVPALVEAGKKDVEYLVGLLKTTESPRLNLWIIDALGRTEDKQVIPALVEKLNDPDEAVRAKVIGSLATIGGPKDFDTEIITRLKEMLKSDPSSSVRFQLIHTLSGWPDFSITSVLVDLLGDKDSQVRSASSEALVKFHQFTPPESPEGETEEKPDIIDLLIRKLAQSRLGGIREEKEAKEISAIVQREIIIIFGRLKDKRCLEILTDLLAGEDDEIKSLAANALGGIADKETIKFLMERLKVETDVRTKIQIMQIFQQAQDQETIPLLIEMLKDSEEDVRLGASRTLRQLTKRAFGTNYESWKKWWDNLQGK